MRAAYLDGPNHVLRVHRQDHADGELPVVGGVVGVEGSAPGIEPDLPADLAAEVPSQPRSVDVGRGSRIGELQAAPSSRCDAFGWYPTAEATNVSEGL
jgi:hypothetical protein